MVTNYTQRLKKNGFLLCVRKGSTHFSIWQRTFLRAVSRCKCFNLLLCIQGPTGSKKQTVRWMCNIIYGIYEI